ncbi:MAG: hypothetical protein KGM96_02745 [Acidobacteriota bacterium]|nr:hypothetical protein [Acidobacteriota bacterium]
MKRIGGFITATALSALFAAGAFGGAQNPQPQGQIKQQQRQQDRSKQQQRGKQLPPGQQKRQQQGPRQRRPPVQQMQRTEQQQREQQVQQRNVWSQHRAHQWNNERRTWQQRGGYNGYRIPDIYYRSHYGPRRWFRIYSLPFMVMNGFPRFQYGGYWFTLMDPYPEYWGPYWYETDDCYIVWMDGGYYLFNRRYPGRPGIAIIVSF